MPKIADILRAAGVDVSTLDVIFQADMETIHRLTVPGADAIQTWEKLHGLVPQTGCWPVLLGDDENLEVLKDHLRRLRYPRAVRILEEAAAIDALEWFENRRLDEIDELERVVQEEEYASRRSYYETLLAQQGPYKGMPQGPWPDDVRPTQDFPMNPYEPGGGEPTPRLSIGLVSTPHGWQAPAYLRYGAWYDCPSAAEHAAILKFWSEEYGAEVVRIAGHAVEMKVGRPPTDRDDALELAAQHYLYCGDIVSQRTKTLQRLAAGLLGGTGWFFRWD